jgi:hypothetical protein
MTTSTVTKLPNPTRFEAKEALANLDLGGQVLLKLTVKQLALLELCKQLELKDDLSNLNDVVKELESVYDLYSAAKSPANTNNGS